MQKEAKQDQSHFLLMIGRFLREVVMTQSSVRFFRCWERASFLTATTVWDVRSFSKPIALRGGITTLYPTTNAVFSPDEKYIVTGAGAAIKGGKGKLIILRRGDLEVVKEVEMDSTPVKVLWHPKINQAGTPQTRARWKLIGCLSDSGRPIKWTGLMLLLARVFIERR